MKTGFDLLQEAEHKKIQKWGEEFNHPKETAQDLIDLAPALNKQQEDFILMRKNE